MRPRLSGLLCCGSPFDVKCARRHCFGSVGEMIPPMRLAGIVSALCRLPSAAISGATSEPPPDACGHCVEYLYPRGQGDDGDDLGVGIDGTTEPTQGDARRSSECERHGPCDRI